MMQVPSFVIESFGGLFGNSAPPPSFFLFFAVGFVQYLSNIPSLSHFARDLCIDSASTPL
jgi:hypothetical protein